MKFEHASLGKACGSMLTKDSATAMMQLVMGEHDARAVMALQCGMPVLCCELVLTHIAKWNRGNSACQEGLPVRAVSCSCQSEGTHHTPVCVFSRYTSGLL